MCLKKVLNECWVTAESYMNPSIHPFFSTPPRSGPSSESWSYPEAFAQIAMPGIPLRGGVLVASWSDVWTTSVGSFSTPSSSGSSQSSSRMSELLALSLKLSPATLRRNFISLFLYECFNLIKIHISHILKYESHSRQLSRVESHAIESALTSSLHSCLFLTLSFHTFWLPPI